MATPKMLVSEDSLKISLKISDEVTDETLSDTLKRAVLLAQARVEALWGVNTLQRGDFREVFKLDSDRHNGIQPNDYFQLLLQNALLSGTPAVSVYLSSEDTPTTVDAADFRVDRERGIVYVKNKYVDYTAEVAYTSGALAPADLPDWMAQAIMSTVPLAFLKIAPATETITKEGAKLAAEEAALILDGHARNTGFMMRGLMM